MSSPPPRRKSDGGMRALSLKPRSVEMRRSGEATSGGAATHAPDTGSGVTPGQAVGLEMRGPGQAVGQGLDGLEMPALSGLPARHVCPFCGSVNESAEGTCPRCTMENTAETRKATKSRLGTWYVVQSRNPSAPG